MGWNRSESEALSIVEQMKNKNKNGYITQGVSFSKDNERHMELLKLCLMYSGSFSGLVKELLANNFDEITTTTHDTPVEIKVEPVPTIKEVKREEPTLEVEGNQNFDLGNFVL